jgi:hypothetical protein
VSDPGFEEVLCPDACARAADVTDESMVAAIEGRKKQRKEDAVEAKTREENATVRDEIIEMFAADCSKRPGQGVKTREELFPPGSRFCETDPCVSDAEFERKYSKPCIDSIHWEVKHRYLEALTTCIEKKKTKTDECRLLKMEDEFFGPHVANIGDSNGVIPLGKAHLPVDWVKKLEADCVESCKAHS